MADFPPIIQTPRKFPSGCGPNAPKTGAAFRWLFQTDQTQTQGPPQTQISPARTTVPGSGSQRERVLKALERFKARCRDIRTSNPEVTRVDLKAFKELKHELRLGNARSIGPIPGVEVGEQFNYRAELIIAGVHSKLQNGIDYALFKETSSGPIATCVVAREGYSDKMNDSDFLVYEGEGGFTDSKADQRMTRGNKALKNSSEVKNDVRVVRGVKAQGQNDGGVVYVYDGLYQVKDWRVKTGRKGNKVFEFDMRRNPEQKIIDWKRIVWKGI